MGGGAGPAWLTGRVDGYDASTYGERWAANYDRWTVTSGIAATTAAAVAGLTQLLDDIGHPSGPALELGVGTGRVALPLADRGVAIHGIDSSPAMVERLRAKPGGQDIPVTVGDFADVAVDATFPLVFAVFNTFFALRDQAAQVRCFAAVAEHLTPGGVFVLETFVPDPARFADGQRVAVGDLDVDSAALEVSLHDPVRQQVRSHHLHVSAEEVRVMPVVIRYAWPSELDLMAQLAGLRLRHRWAGWSRAPFTAASRVQIAVYDEQRS